MILKKSIFVLDKIRNWIEIITLHFHHPQETNHTNPNSYPLQSTQPPWPLTDPNRGEDQSEVLQISQSCQNDRESRKGRDTLVGIGDETLWKWRMEEESKNDQVEGQRGKKEDHMQSWSWFVPVFWGLNSPGDCFLSVRSKKKKQQRKLVHFKSQK